MGVAVKIAFVTETWLPHVDGVITRLEATIRRLVARGHQVLVIAPSRGVEIPGVRQEVIRHALIPVIDRRRPWALPDRRIGGLVEAFEPDVIHLVSPVLMGVLAARQLAGRYPTVTSFHTDLAAYTGQYGLGVLRPLLNRLTRITYQRADVRLVTSPTGRRRLSAIGVDPSSISIWPPAVGNPYLATENGWQPMLDPRTESVFCIGRLAREKEWDRLLPAARLATSQRCWPITFIGDGPDRSRLRRLFADTSTTFAGLRRGQELITQYRRAAVVAFTSTTDTVGLVLLEAAALGRPVVAVDTPASRDALAGYPRAVFVDGDCPAEGWLSAFRSAAATRPSDGGGTRWRPGTWDESTDILLAAYLTAIASRRSFAARELSAAS